MAESVVVADNVELIANNIQSKVGATLIGLRGTAKATTDTQSEGATGILDNIKKLQTTAVEKLTEIWEVLAAQLKFDENEARRLREERKDQFKKAKFKGGTGKSIDETAGEVGDNEGGGLLGWIAKNPFLSALFITGVGSWMTTAKAFLVKFGGTLLRGGFYAIVAKMIGDAIVKKIGAEEGSMTEQAFSKYIPMSIFGFMMTRTLPGALIAVAATGMFSVIEYLTGKKNFKDVSGFDWGAASLSGVAATFGIGSILTMVGAKGGAIATLGGMLAAWPVVLTVGIGVALGVGIKWLAGKIGEYKISVLDDLDEFGKLTQDEFEKRLKEQKSHWFARMFPSLAGTVGIDLTDMQKANITSGDMVSNIKKKKEVDTRNAMIIEGIADNLLNLSNKGLKDVLSDKHRASEHMDFLNDMEYLIQSQAFGPEKSAEFSKLLSAHKNQIQKMSMEIHTENQQNQKKTASYVNDIIQGKTEGSSDEMEVLRKMNFMPRYESISGLAGLEAERMKFLSDLGYKHGIKEGEAAPYSLKATMSPENWEKLQAMEQEMHTMRILKKELDRDVGMRLGKDFDYEKQIKLLGLEDFLTLYYQSLNVQIEKIGRKWKLMENNRSYPQNIDASTIVNQSNAKKNNVVNYTGTIFGTGRHQPDVNKPNSLLPPSMRQVGAY